MTTEKLQQILQSDKALTLNEVKEIIYELKNDCVVFREDRYEAGFYNGELNAFYICLDLLEKVNELLDVVTAIRKNLYPNCSICSLCERDVIICQEEGRCMKNA